MNQSKENRIYIYLDQLQAFWELHPEWRFVQLVENVARSNPPSGRIKGDIFPMTDEEFFDKLKVYPYV